MKTWLIIALVFFGIIILGYFGLQYYKAKNIADQNIAQVTAQTRQPSVAPAVAAGNVAAEPGPVGSLTGPIRLTNTQCNASCKGRCGGKSLFNKSKKACWKTCEASVCNH